MKRILIRPSALFCLVSIMFFLLWLGMDSVAFARAGGGRSSGSRGYSSGGSTQRAPSQSSTPSPQQRDFQQQAQPQRPPLQQPAGTGRSFFSGVAGGLVGGLLGGMLFRSLGFGGGSDGGGGGFGFSDILIILIILAIIYFVVKRFRSRETMQMSTAGAGSVPYSYTAPPPEPSYAPPVQNERGSEGLRHISETDSSFSESKFKELAEDIFFKIQGGWTKRDLKGVRHLLTPEMLNIFQQDVDRLLAEKKINRLENIAVRNVEIVDAGQDRGEEYITVKFHASLLDYVVDEASGKLISGSAADPVKFLEYWTFSRMVGEKTWVLAGITQEGDY